MAAKFFKLNGYELQNGMILGVSRDIQNTVAIVIEGGCDADLAAICKQFSVSEIDEYDFADLKDAGCVQLYKQGNARFFGVM